MRYFLQLAYDGAGFHGWQTQPNACSVQQTIEEALCKVLREPVKLTGAGRTDTGVNARRMFAHFDVPTPIADSKKLLSGLNRLVGRGIALQRLIGVSDDAHARFDATSRTYKYYVIFEKSPFLSSSSWHSPALLDVKAMNEAASVLLDTQDFTSFAKLHSDSKTNICRVTEAKWENFDNIYTVPGIEFTITADRFLRNMVRAIVGTLVEVGRGKLSIEDFKRIINQRDRCAAGTSMPPQALFLWDITYPYIKTL